MPATTTIRKEFRISVKSNRKAQRALPIGTVMLTLPDGVTASEYDVALRNNNEWKQYIASLTTNGTRPTEWSTRLGATPAIVLTYAATVDVEHSLSGKIREQVHTYQTRTLLTLYGLDDAAALKAHQYCYQLSEQCADAALKASLALKANELAAASDVTPDELLAAIKAIKAGKAASKANK